MQRQGTRIRNLEAKAVGYSDMQRQGILEDIVDYRIMTKDEVLSYLNFFMKLNHNGSDVRKKGFTSR